MLRLDENPLARFPEGKSIKEDMGRWWVLRVKPRNEKALARELAQLGVGYYLPMFTKRTIRRDNGKIRKSVVCLFPGYISITDYPLIKETLFRTGRVMKIIKIMGQAQFASELESIRRVLERTEQMEVHPHLVKGERVIIVEGALKGVEGVISDVREQDKVFLNVEMFGRAVSVRVFPEWLMPLDDPYEDKIRISI